MLLGKERFVGKRIGLVVVVAAVICSLPSWLHSVAPFTVASSVKKAIKL